MLFFRAIPFSFAIQWRYLLVLPVLIVALVIFGFLAVMMTLVVGLISPFFGVMVAVAFGVASSVIPIMVGMRIGLQAKRIRARNSYGGLMIPALGYGLFEGLCILIILVLASGLYLLATPLTITDLSTFEIGNQEAIIAKLMDISPLVTVALVVIGTLLTIALRTALLVPFASASIGADPDGKSHTPFMGFGGGFWSNFALVIVSYVGAMFVVPILMMLTVPLGMADRLVAAALLRDEYETLNEFAIFIPDFAILAGLALFLYLFFFSFQCAGPVLYVADQHAGTKARHRASDAEALAGEQAAAPAPHMQETDLKELLRSRMPTKRN